jgi:membrane-associated phospholipid phosphatase
VRPPSGPTRIVRLLPVAVTLALAAFVFLYRGVRRGAWAERDLAATVAVQKLRAPLFREFMRLVSWPGFPPQSRVIPWLLAAYWLVQGKRREAAFQLLGWGTGLISFAVKHRVKRPRPSHPSVVVALARIGGTSFPSGHVLNYVGIYGTLAYLLLRQHRPGWPRRLALAAVALLLSCVGLSRMYLGHHWLTDVSASYLLGSSYLWALTGIYERLRRRTGPPDA